MTASPYKVWGPSISPMMGRTSLVRRIEDNWLNMEVPRHVSVVGPAYYGKSVLLRYVAEAHRMRSACYLTTAYIDLRDGTPDSDDSFKRRLADEVKTALHQVHLRSAEWIDIEDENVHELLNLVFEELDGKSKRLLVVLDGFDSVLERAGLTPTLWSQLREIASRTSLRLLTGSRQPLRELCRTGESRASPFWNIFHYEPVRVHALDETDWPAFLKPLRDTGCDLEETARKAIINWTGGVPVLVCALLDILWTEHQGERVSKQVIDHAAERLLRDPSGLLGPLWDDCDHEVRSDLDALSKDGIPLTRSVDRRRSVVDRGFGRVSRDRIRGSCLLMQRYAEEEQAPAMTDLNRIFGNRHGFDRHIRSLLELRLKQVKTAGVDEELCRFVGNAVQHIASWPQDALTWVRSIAERALDVVWAAELPPDRTLPAEWTREWDEINERYRDDQGKLPRSLGDQCHILRLATGTKRTTRCTRHITKTTFLLLDHLQSVGNFGQHRADATETEVTIGFAASVVLSAISLVECLTSDLSRKVDSA